MDGFGPGLDGYFDAEPALREYLRERSAERFATARGEKRSLDSRAAVEERRDRVRAQFLASIGGLPDRIDDPSVETTGVVDRDGFSVECVVLESRPSFHVTANCYVPDGDGPHPAVLFLCGHAQAAKADPMNQRACVELASNGFVVLAVDPIAQGEREQYRDPETGDALVEGGGGVFAHCYAGQQCFYAGANLARFVIHDDRVALDHLFGRDDVDTDRVGVTGTSGGGVQTAYLGLLDDRIAAAAPCCAITEREEWLLTGKRIDAEQCPAGAIAHGVNHDDFLAAMAPRPICVGAAASDEYVPIEGVHAAVERTRQAYDQYDTADAVGHGGTDAVELVVADETHCSVYELGDGIFEWFCDTLGDTRYEPYFARDSPDEHDLVGRDALLCTPGGSVVAAYPDERTIDDLVRAFVAKTAPDGSSRPVVDDRDRYAAGLRTRLAERFGLDRDACDRHPRYTTVRESDGLRIRHVFFRTERDPDAVVAGVLVADPDTPTTAPAVALYENGTEALPDRSDDVASLAAEYGTVFVFDPRGVGAVRNRHVPVPVWADDYYAMYGTEFKLAYDALLLSSSLFGLRVFDVLQAADYLRTVTDSNHVALVGEGVGAYHALYAAVADPAVERIDLGDLGPSFHEMATSREYPYDPRLTVYDVVEDCDVPHCLAALDDRDLSVERTSP